MPEQSSNESSWCRCHGQLQLRGRLRRLQGRRRPMNRRIRSGAGRKKKQEQNAKGYQQARLVDGRPAHSGVKNIPPDPRAFNQGLPVPALAQYMRGTSPPQVLGIRTPGQKFCSDTCRFQFRPATSVIWVRHFSSCTIFRLIIPNPYAEEPRRCLTFL